MIAYLNGTFLPKDEAKVSIEDRGYQFADGIYEVILLRNGKLAFLPMHLDRLWRSAKGLELTLPFTRPELEAIMAELLEKNGMRDGALYMQVTRGVFPRNHSFPPAETKSSVVIYLKPPYAGGEIGAPSAVITHEDNRWLDPWIKSVSLLPNIMAREAAVRRGAREAVLVRDGIVTECSSSNFFIVKDGTLITHPATRLILNGITRQVILRCASATGVPVQEREFTVAEAFTADEAFFSATSAFLTPAVSIDGKAIGDGKPGPVTQKLLAAFMDVLKENVGETAAVSR